MQQHDRFLERQGVPDLHLAVGALKYARAGVEFRANHDSGLLCAQGADSPEEKYEGRSLLNALQHAVFCQVVGSIVVPHLYTEAHSIRTGVREMASMYRWYKFLLYLEAHALKLEVDG